MIFVLLGANFMMILAVVFKFGSLPPQIPLFYSRPDGELQLGQWWFIFIIPALLNLTFLLNNFLVKKYFPANSFVETFVYYFNLFLIISFTLIFLKIIFLVA